LKIGVVIYEARVGIKDVVNNQKGVEGSADRQDTQELSPSRRDRKLQHRTASHSNVTRPFRLREG